MHWPLWQAGHLYRTLYTYIRMHMPGDCSKIAQLIVHPCLQHTSVIVILHPKHLLFCTLQHSSCSIGPVDSLILQIIDVQQAMPINAILHEVQAAKEMGLACSGLHLLNMMTFVTLVYFNPCLKRQ